MALVEAPRPSVAFPSMTENGKPQILVADDQPDIL